MIANITEVMHILSRNHSIILGGGEYVNVEGKLLICTLPMTITHITTAHHEVTAYKVNT
jgi:hypothetical protein